MILGIECTAHTFGVGISDKGKILANVRDMYKTSAGGIVPMESAKHHKAVAEEIYQRALAEANIEKFSATKKTNNLNNFSNDNNKKTARAVEPKASPQINLRRSASNSRAAQSIYHTQIKAIAISNAPGLAPCLLAGMEFAKKKSKELNIPLIPVNHCIAHLEIGQSVGAHDPVLLYVSGANTQIISYASGKYRVFGETLDLGIGNFIDKIARTFGFGFPGGPEIEKLSKSGKYLPLPYSIKGMDVSFSGMQTKIQQLYKKEISANDLAFSLQETAFAMVIEAAERALAHTEKSELVLGGGVACNSRLQEMCRIMCAERKAKFFCPPRELLVDNGAMIAYTGEIMFNAGVSFPSEKVDIKPRERTDQVEVTWK